MGKPGYNNPTVPTTSLLCTRTEVGHFIHIAFFLIEQL
jgi:hypothetical protein